MFVMSLFKFWCLCGRRSLVSASFTTAYTGENLKKTSANDTATTASFYFKVGRGFKSDAIVYHVFPGNSWINNTVSLEDPPRELKIDIANYVQLLVDTRYFYLLHVMVFDA